MRISGVRVERSVGGLLLSGSVRFIISLHVQDNRATSTHIELMTPCKHADRHKVTKCAT